jgi:hypothetical protein
MADFILPVLQVPANNIKNKSGHGMSYMGFVIYRWSTDIHGNLAGLKGFKIFFFPG